VPTNSEFNDDILSVEYETFSCGFDVSENLDEGFCVEYDSFSFAVHVGLDVDMCAEYESFSFDPIQANLLFESHKSKFIESKVIVTEHFDLDQTHERIELEGLMDLGPTVLPRPFIQDDHISRPMTYRLATIRLSTYFLIG